MSSVRFSKHARDQLRERNISEREVKSCIIDPDKVVVQDMIRFRAVRRINRGGRAYALIVVYDKGKEIEVVTAFYSSKIKKYL